MIRLKRVYEEAEKKDGRRVLVDRLWPRGLAKEKAEFDEWPKEVAPSEEIRKKFGHDPDKWKDFKSLYLKELRKGEAKKIVERLLVSAKKGNLTLLYGAKDELHNNAVVLKKHLERKLKNL